VIFMSTNVIMNVFFNAAFKQYFPSILQSPINAGAFVMLAGFIIVPVVSVLTKAPAKELVEDCFSCYDQTVSVKVRDDLGGGEKTAD